MTILQLIIIEWLFIGFISAIHFFIMKLKTYKYIVAADFIIGIIIFVGGIIFPIVWFIRRRVRLRSKIKL